MEHVSVKTKNAFKEHGKKKNNTAEKPSFKKIFITYSGK